MYVVNRKNTIAEFASFADNLFDLDRSENVRQGLNLWRFNDFKPFPVTLNDMPPKELQAISIYFDGAPRMGLDQLSEVGF